MFFLDIDKYRLIPDVKNDINETDYMQKYPQCPPHSKYTAPYIAGAGRYPNKL